ncbi:transposase [Clostridium thermarum]|uniref:transposase n=1 Tax=Clostridium thermarum TaxID=1716543 RepID=UPI001FAB3479|nr:transposase [Clostridium thermarum]
MPRVARIKNEAGIYHIMVRSISDVALFRDDVDKDKYLHLIKKYQQIFLFKVYAYCLMTTHGHIVIDCCGADISKIMKSINQCYAAYFNKKYNRHGHVFQDRFKSKLVDDERYLVTLSAYIHNNPKDITRYEKCVERYKYSSLGVYLGIFHDEFYILGTDFILGHFSINVDRARKSYLEYINRISDRQEEIDVEFINEGSECRSERKILLRDVKAEDIIDFVSKYTNQYFNIHIKFNHRHIELKAVCILIMRSLGNYSHKDICQYIGNVTISTVSRLCEKGYSLITEDNRYKSLISDIIKELSIA